MGYIKQLDSVRAIAVLLVLVWHWFPRTSIMENLHAGSLGVDIFFVLSGFLITEILLRHRGEAESSMASKTNVLRNFYIRRVLRIFPIYYLTILLTAALNHWLALGVTKNEILCSLTYTNNFFVYLSKVWPTSTVHFWSLAVEEQFYLAWPLIMLYWPKKYLTAAILSFVTIGLISQLLITDVEFGYLPTNTSLDCFGIGALLAYVIVFHPKCLQNFYNLMSFFLVAVIIILAICWILNTYFKATRFAHAIIAGWLISYILIYRDRKSLLISFLSKQPLVSIGKVSYGIYLYHILYVYIANKLWYKYVYDYYYPFINQQLEPWIFTTIHFCILYLICWLSWKFIERPFLSLKSKFQYE